MDLGPKGAERGIQIGKFTGVQFGKMQGVGVSKQRGCDKRRAGICRLSEARSGLAECVPIWVIVGKLCVKPNNSLSSFTGLHDLGCAKIV